MSTISRIYASVFKGANGENPFKFKSQKSSKAVTTKVKIVRTGNMTLIDSPGTNDPDKRRTDK